MIGIALGLFAYTLFGVAMALMKVGAPALARPRDIPRDPALRRAFALWLVGGVLNLVNAAVLAVALGFGRASVLGALNGFGLVVLAILSHRFLGERVTTREIGGIALIVIGTGILGWEGAASGATGGAPDILAPDADARLMQFSVVAMAIGTIGPGLAFLRRRDLVAQSFGISAGLAGGIALLCQKSFMAALLGGLTLSGLLVHPAFLLFLVVANLTFVLVQVAYQFGEAVLVVPVMSAAVILTPVFGGAFVYGDPLTASILGAVLVIVLGVLRLTGRPASPEPVGACSADARQAASPDWPVGEGGA